MISFVELSPILISYVLGFFVFRGFYANFPIYLQLKTGLSENEIVNYWSIISTVALFMGGISRIPAGIISDRIGRLKAIFLGYILYLFALFILFIYEGLFIYILSISILRMTLNLFAMSGRGIVAASEREKGFKNGLLSSMVGFGGLLGPLLLSLSLDRFDPDFMITITVFLILVDAFIFLISLKIVPIIFSKICTREMELPMERVHRGKSEALKYFKNKEVIKSISLFFSSGIVYGLITVIYTIYGYNVLKMDVVLLGLIVGLGALSNIIIAPITGMLYMRFRDENIRVIAWFGLVFATFIVGFGRISTSFFIAGYFIMGFSNAMFFTMEITRLGRIVNKEAFSVIFGTATTLVIIGSAIASSVTKFLYQIHTEATFYTAFIIASITFTLVIITYKKPVD